VSSARDIVGEPVVASTGNRFLFAEVASRAALKAASCNLDGLPQAPADGAHGRRPSLRRGQRARRGDPEPHVRPLFGVPEDPATGSANVSLIGLLAHRDPRPDLVLTQADRPGLRHGPPSLLDASAEKKAGTVVATYVGGRCVPMLSGTIEL
jgi:trans-2,3-dihydro-3-hydroxyanthranilate isomerase